jgi:O-antigen/teichoic acid export membrane protein
MLIANGVTIFFFAKPLINWRPAYDRILSPQIFRYAYPMMLMGLAGMTNEMFSRLTLEWWLPHNFYGPKSAASALGIFGTCYKFAVLMQLATTAFRYAADPFFFSNASDKNSPQLFARVNHYFIIVGCVFWLAVSTNLDFLKLFTGSSYWEGLGIVPILMLGFLFLGIYYNVSIWFKVTDKTYVGTIITTAGAFLTIVLNFILIPIAGYYGSSWATLIVYAAMAIGCYIWGQKTYPIPYTIVSDGTYIAITAVLIYLSSRIAFENNWMGGIVHLVVLLLFTVTVVLVEYKKGDKPAINKADLQ